MNDAWKIVIVIGALVAIFVAGMGVSRQITESRICSYHCTVVHGKKPSDVRWQGGKCHCQYTYEEPK